MSIGTVPCECGWKADFVLTLNSSHMQEKAYSWTIGLLPDWIMVNHLSLL